MEDENTNIRPEKIELTIEDMIKGIGRKATDEELIDYLSKDGGIPVSLEIAFAKYEA